MHCFWTKIHYTSHKLRHLQRYKLRAMGYRIQGLRASYVYAGDTGLRPSDLQLDRLAGCLE